MESVADKTVNLPQLVPKRIRSQPLQLCFSNPCTVDEFLENSDNDQTLPIEIGLDEAGRGSLIGGLYTGAFCLPTDYSSIQKASKLLNEVRDSKRITEKKRNRICMELKKIALAYAVDFATQEEVEKNVLYATLKSFHRCIDKIREQISKQPNQKEIQLIAVDGDKFLPYYYTENKEEVKANEEENEEEAEAEAEAENEEDVAKMRDTNDSTNSKKFISYTTIKDGDTKYINIAAASILAKCARDAYIYNLCEENKEMSELFHWKTNKGYGEKHHMNIIKTQQLYTEYHRKSFQPVKGLIRLQQK